MSAAEGVPAGTMLGVSDLPLHAGRLTANKHVATLCPLEHGVCKPLCITTLYDPVLAAQQEVEHCTKNPVLDTLESHSFDHHPRQVCV